MVLAGLAVTVVNLVSPNETELKFGPLELTTTHIGLAIVCVGLAYLTLLFRGFRERLSNVELFSDQDPAPARGTWVRIGGRTAFASLLLFAILLGIAIAWHQRG